MPSSHRFPLRLVPVLLCAAILLPGSAAQVSPNPTGSSAPEAWWKHAVIYEIYPRSFQDSDGDGVGDLNGIIQRLDYLQQLGVDAIWLTPIYPSPQADFGYDISDYTAIDPQYGTLADFDRLVREAKRRNIRVMMDLVLNHTSDKHPWFIESASSRTNPKRDWYIWRDGKPRPDGKLAPPNNWVNRIEQTAWQYDPNTKQFFYHYYATEQPDLNWRNPQVEKAMFAAAKYWLDRGVAGFRLDAINTLFEDPNLTDAPAEPGTNEYGEPSLSMIYQRNLPEVHGVLRHLRQLTDSFDGSFDGQRVLVGEIYTRSTAELAAWYGANHDELQLPMDTNVGFINRLDAASFRTKLQEADEQFAGNTPLFVFDNHDRPRSWDRYGDGKHNVEIAKMLAAVLLASRSASLVYEGQEIGMKTTTPTRKEDVRDPRGLAGWPKEKGRDGERTPMQWTGTKNAGFSSATKTWLPIPPSFTNTNVAVESADPQSLLTWYRDLIKLRRSAPALADGDTVLLNRDPDNALVWVRRTKVASDDSPAIVVACNMSAKPITLTLQADMDKLGIRGSLLRRLMSSGNSADSMSVQRVTLAPFATYIGEVSVSGSSASR